MTTKCAFCGLVYDKDARPLPACKSEDGVDGPSGVTKSALVFGRCVLTANVIKVPDVKGPKGMCWVQAPSMERCTYRFGHPGKHQWDVDEHSTRS